MQLRCSFKTRLFESGPAVVPRQPNLMLRLVHAAAAADQGKVPRPACLLRRLARRRIANHDHSPWVGRHLPSHPRGRAVTANAQARVSFGEREGERERERERETQMKLCVLLLFLFKRIICLQRLRTKISNEIYLIGISRFVSAIKS